jgi:Uma2 family endonuclease
VYLYSGTFAYPEGYAFFCLLRCTPEIVIIQFEMTTLLIQSEQTPMTVNFPLIAQMTTEQFYEFCLANRDLRIERTATGEVIIMPPAFSETGNRNMKIAQQVANWTEKDGTGETFDSSAGFTLPNGAIRSPDSSWIRSERWNALTNE